ncbi:hypothetical protein WOLCODRAFT_145752 [Wolfiporia cocos MD-104 SS10]|uniref:Uncharacterized protein n=1 Tax=Wolfiporia cocos (strain MD-104) TaxID=742152 RepID=A0A2H3J6A6_WOLCO|nr:hypothetical protein WOLCODRAFT_145752 [Wolfiporia cocos MD-104 SS10]
MISNVNANALIETARQSAPLVAVSSTKATNALDPCGKVFEGTGHRDSEGDAASQDKESELTRKNVPGVPPPSEITHQYTCWDLAAAAAGYAARLTADLRSFRGLFECINDRALASDVLDSLFGEIKQLEAAYRARRAKAEQPRQCEYSADIDEDGGDKDFAHDEEESSYSIGDAGVDEHEKLLDASEWREVDEASECGETSSEDEDGSNTDAIHRTPSPAVGESTDDGYYSDEVIVNRRPAKFQRSSSNTDLVKDEEFDSGTLFNVLDCPPKRDRSAGDDGYGASVSSNSEIDWRLDGPSATNIHSTLSNLPTPTTPTARALPLAHIPDYAGRLDAPVQIQQPTYLQRVRPGITGLFGDFPEPFFAPLNAEIEAQTASPAPTCARKAGTGRGVHRHEQCSRRARFDGPYRQHYLRRSSVPRGEGAGAPAGVRRNATAPDLSRNRAA